MTLHVEQHGEGDPLVVLPSFGLDHRAMAAAVDTAFAAVPGWARLYCDLPGTGLSAGGDPTSDAVVGAVAQTLDEHLGGRPFALAGWSYGSYLAAGLARRRAGQIRGLLLICAGLKIRPQDRDLTGVLDSVAQHDWLAEVPVELHEHLRQAVGRQTRAVAGRIAAVIDANGPTDEAYLDALRADGFALSDEDAATVLDAPSCVLAGRRDRVAGYQDPFRALDHLGQAECTVLADAGHYLPLEAPDRLAASVAVWLNRCRRPGIST